MEKTFLSQEAGMIRLSFDKKIFLIEATQVPILKIRGGSFFWPGTVQVKKLRKIFWKHEHVCRPDIYVHLCDMHVF